MNEDRWGPDGPPLEAYSRVTNPERFAPLHDIATQLLDRLELEFDAERTEGYGLDPELEKQLNTVARPTVILMPREVDGAPVAVSFSTFPGLYVRFGRWQIHAFPGCGCDACDETAEGEAERLEWLIRNVTEGRFREAISISDSGPARRRTDVWSGDGRSEGSESALEPADARQLLAGGQRSTYLWAPWSKRKRPTADWSQQG